MDSYIWSALLHRATINNNNAPIIGIIRFAENLYQPIIITTVLASCHLHNC